MTIDGILEAYDETGGTQWKPSYFIELGYDFSHATLLAGAPQLAAEVRRLRERERVLVEMIGEFVTVPTRECGGAHGFVAWVRNRSSSALEAVKE